MNLLGVGVGFFVGFLVGAGVLLLYMRWKMMSQLNAMQRDMEGMFDATDGLMDDMADMDDLGLESEEEKD
jgi:hypothetical protein